MTKTMKVEGPLHVICQCDKCKPQISFNAEVIGYVEPQRPWVGLTDDEIDGLHNEIKVRLMGTFDTKDIYRVIEYKLKELNT